MRWLYRLQTRLGLTGPEGTALLVVSLALASGFAVSEWTSQQATPVAEIYEADDVAFALLDAPTDLPADTLDGEAGPSAPAVTLPALADGALPPDTTREADDEVVAAEDTPVVVGPVADAPPRSRRKPPPVVTNINTAGDAELQRLPRIGPAMAGRILEYRRQHGSFRSVEQLVEVRGIGEKTLEKLRPWVRL